MNNSGLSDRPVQPGIDLLEVYCSADSQLTNQSTDMVSWPRRLGLKEGSLCYYEGRCKLYDVLYRCRPRHVWLSPKCKAWCKWNQFNASKSPEMARKVLEAQSDDLVHLQRCEFSLSSRTASRIGNAESRSSATDCTKHSSCKM